MKINWVRLGLAILLSGVFLIMTKGIATFTDTERIEITMLLCFSLLLFGLAFETKE